MQQKHGMARGIRVWVGKRSYSELLWDAASGDCSPACSFGTSGQLKHMKIIWSTTAHNKNQVKQNASTCKPFRSSVKSLWGPKHTFVPKGGEICIARPTTDLSKSQCWIFWVTCLAPAGVLFFEESCLSVAPWNIYVCWCAERCEGQQYRCDRCFVSQKVKHIPIF